MKRLFVAALAIGCAALRIPLAFGETPKQGGSAVVTFNNDLTTLDPQVGYDWQNWSVIKSIFDGLMDYKLGRPSSSPTSPRNSPFPTMA